MTGYHGIIFAYSASPELGSLVTSRTAASLPFCGRYRLIDFALSSMRNAGITDVGVIMQRDYQSLLDHLGGGKPWDMSRKSGGLRMLPPFGLPEYHRGNYTGTMEALNAVSTYIRDIPQNNVVLMLGNVCANIDLSAAIAKHAASGAEITAICADYSPADNHHRYVVDKDGFVSKILFDRTGGDGFASLEGYIIKKDTLLRLMDECKAENLYRFHKDAIPLFLSRGGKMDVYIHHDYVQIVRSVNTYYNTSMDMLCRDKRNEVFPKDRPVRTKINEGVSTYYGENASCVNSLVADNCIVEGTIENCILFSGVRIAPGANLKNCILMRGSIVEKNAKLEYVIADKYVTFSHELELKGSAALPFVVPKSTAL